MPDAGHIALAGLQRGLLDAIAGRRAADERLLAHLAGDARADGAARLAIYADMYLGRLHEALSFQFPALAAALGEDDFLALVEAYLAACPPRSPSLRWVGDRLAGFLAAAAPEAPWHRPWVADLARLEYARLDVFDDRDVGLLAREQAQRAAPEELAALPLRLVPAHRVLQLDFAIEPTWRALDAGEETAAPRRAPHALLVWRQGTEVYHRALEGLEAALLPSLHEVLPLGVLCERVAARAGDEDAGRVAFALIARWLDDELLAAP